MRLDDLVAWLDEILAIHDFADPSLNGLQIEGREEVRHVALAVDACLATIQQAAESGADLLLVHHGLFWGQEQALVGPHGRRVRAAVCAELSLYAAHIPLDAHHSVGNNAELCRLLGMLEREPFGTFKGQAIGLKGRVEPMTLQQLTQRLGAVLGAEVWSLPFGPDTIEQVGVVSGGGASSLVEAREQGLHALVTGEASHPHYFDAEEGGVHLLLGGHYATETLGVRALGQRISQELGLRCTFIDHPTGM